MREHNIKMIIIDYLQLMNASGMKFGSREQEVSTISRSLKQLAKERKEADESGSRHDIFQYKRFHIANLAQS